MNLLLLFSAILTALTGFGGASRVAAPVAATAPAAPAEAGVRAVARVVAATRPEQGMVAAASVLHAPFDLPLVIKPWASRRRE